MENSFIENSECLEAEKLKNVIFFLISENVSLGKDIEDELSKCFSSPFIKKKTARFIRKKKKHSPEKIILSFSCPEEKKEEAVRITFDDKVLYAYPQE